MSSILLYFGIVYVLVLKQKSKIAELKIDDYVLFSKNGFSSEILETTDKDITFLSRDNLSSLLDNLSEKDLLVYKNRKY